MKRSLGYAELSSPIHEVECFASECNGANSSRIASLFESSSPSNISRFVAALVVNSIDAMDRRWSLADMGEECLEARVPFGANLDPPAAIVVKARMGGITAARSHREPREVFWSPGYLVRASWEIGLGKRFISPTAARRGVSGCEIPKLDDPNHSTETATFKTPGPIFALSNLPYDCESAELPSRFDLQWHHAIVYHASQEQVTV